MELKPPLKTCIIARLCLFLTGAHNVLYQLPLGGGLKYIKTVGEEYKVVKMRMEYRGCVKDYNVEKRENGRLGRISCGEKGKGTEKKLTFGTLYNPAFR